MSSSNFIFIFLLFQLFSCNRKENALEKAYSEEIPLAGNAYQTNGSHSETFGKDGIESWTNENSKFSIYVNSLKDQKVTLELQLSVPKAASKIEITLNEVKEVLSIDAGTNKVATTKDFTLKSGYNNISFSAIDKQGSNYALVEKLVLAAEDEFALDYVKDNIDNRFYWGRRGPSVHLSYTYSESQDFKWFYNEVTVPVGSDPIGSYYMANGFKEGYFGIQVNSESERRILFSVWSPFETDNPGEIPENEQINLLKKGEDVHTGEFGNEGSGGQSYLVYNWKAGRTYSFLNSIEPDGKGNTIYTAYFMDPAVNEWILIASFLRPKTDTWYKRPHSFLENFVPENGYLTRMAFYDNQWLADADGNWTELTEAKFTGDDIAKRSFRMDYEGGEKDGEFYLKNGGFFNKKYELNSMHQRDPNEQFPTVNLNSLP